MKAFVSEYLDQIPIFDMSKAETMDGIYSNCNKLESEILDHSLEHLKSADNVFCNLII